MTDETTPNTDATQPATDAAPATEAPVMDAPVVEDASQAPAPMVSNDTVKGPDPQGWWRGTGRRKAAGKRAPPNPAVGTDFSEVKSVYGGHSL